MSAGFYRAAIGSMSPKAPTFGEYSFQSSPQRAYFWCAQVIAMNDMYAGFAGAKTGHGRAAFYWCFVLPNSFSSAFATSCRRERYFVFTIGTVRRPGKNPMKPCEIHFQLWYKRGQLCDEV